MNPRLLAATLGAGMLAPGAAALADPFVSPGLTFVSADGEGPMTGFSMGGELTVNDFLSDSVIPLAFGALLQWEFDGEGNSRLNIGGQAFAPLVGAELAWSMTFSDAPTTHQLMAAPFAGIGVVNFAWRNYLFGANGRETATAWSLKAPLTAQVLAPLFLLAGGGGGRPLRGPDGAQLKPRVVVLGPGPAVDLPRASRVALGRAWLEDARAEHAAVEAFERLARQLRRHGAPRSLVRRALRSARDERRHARDCLAVAEHLLGARLALVSTPTPEGPLPDLSAMARESRLDGTVAEGAAARIAAAGARTARSAAVQRILGTIAGEEAGHAALAAGVERWAQSVGGAPVRAALAEARPADPDEVAVGRGAPHGDEALWRRWGRIDLAGRRDAWRAAAA